MRYLLLSLLLASSLFGQATQIQPACSLNFPSTSIVGSGSTKLISGKAGVSIHICLVAVNIVQANTAANFGLTSGTGTNCGTNTTNVTPAWTGVAAAIQGLNLTMPNNVAWSVPQGADVCLNLSAAPTSAQVHIFYDYYQSQ